MDNQKETLAERAVSLFLDGYNCAQALYGAAAPLLGIEEKEALRLASPFGGGFGRQREVCGAFSGMMLAIANFYGYDDLNDPKKSELYPRVQELGKRFQSACGSLVCREILGKNVEVGGSASPRTKAYYESRPCAYVVEQAAQILERYLKEEGSL